MVGKAKKCLLIGIALLVILPVVAAFAPPPPAPSNDFFSVYGDVLINGASAADGAEVTFKVDGVEVGKTIASGGDYAHVISASGDVSNGDVISIYVSGVLATTAVFQSQASENVDLSVTIGGGGNGGNGGPGGGGGGGGGRASEDEEEMVPVQKKPVERTPFDITDLVDGSKITGASVLDFIGKPSTIIGILIILFSAAGVVYYAQARKSLSGRKRT